MTSARGRRTGSIAIVSFAVAVLASACGSKAASPTTSGASTTVATTSAQGASSCTAVTPSEAGGALGQTVKPGVRGRAIVEGGVACVYYGPDAPPGASPDVPVSDSVRVVLVTGPNAKRYYEDYRSKVNARPVGGLGDAAYYDGYASLSVLKGSSYVRIAVIGVPDVLGAEKTLAADALPRIG